MPNTPRKQMESQDELLPLSKAARLTPYTAEYLGLLARTGRLTAVKIGRDWLVRKSAVLKYVRKQERKHKKSLTGLMQAEGKIKKS